MKRIEDDHRRWYGHVNRMIQDRIPRKIMQAKPKGKRSMGRPRMTWMNTAEGYERKRRGTEREMKRLTLD
ncbi:hypothetical protein C0J52_24932 [Blattella germanica]|nr:hypothetical protein C0J52_24932 [Blattella germanica]